MPDGRILVGGHAPIGTLYGPPKTLVPGVTSPQETRNPTFEIYSPPYLFRGDRPVIRKAASVAAPAQDLEITLGPGASASDIDTVVLMRRTAITHLVDGGQRAVELPIVSRNGSKLKVRMPSTSAVVPPGPYLLFVNRTSASGPMPSVKWNVDVTQGPIPPSASTGGSRVAASAPGRDISRAGGVPVDATLAFDEIARVAAGPPVSGSRRAGGGIPWPFWPVLGGVVITAFWTVRRRMAGEASRAR